MNSKQRRIDRRKWKYRVRIDRAKRFEHGYENMFAWCVKSFGNTGKHEHQWRESWNHVGTEWQFTTEEGATLFMMRWS